MTIQKILALLLALVLLWGAAACGAPAADGAGTSAPPESAQALPESAPGAEGAAAKNRMVTDVWGREVEIPQTVESILCLGSGAPRMAAYLEVVDLMVGAEEHDMAGITVLRDYSPVYYDALKALPAVGAGGGSGDNNAYPEEIITLAPQVILAGFSREAAEELQTQTGIPVVAVRYISNGLADDTFYAAMRVFAQVVGAQDRCEAVLSFIDSCKEDLNRRTAHIPDSEKPRAYTGAVTFSGRHGFAGTYSNFGPFAAIHAVNVADEVAREGYYETDFEKILAWDPDIIFLDPGNRNLVNDEYAANPEYFGALRAVREGNVYTMPSFNNCGMNITYALMNAYYAGIVLFPEQFADVDMAGKSAEILTFFLGEDLYDTMAQGGLYYGTITIGE